MTINSLSFEWHIPTSDLIDVLTRLGIHIDNSDTELTKQQFDMLCDEFSKNVNTDFSNIADGLIETINILGPLTARMSPLERLCIISNVYAQLLNNYSKYNMQERSDAKKKVELLLECEKIKFNEMQEKSLLTILDQHRDLKIKFNKEDNAYYIDVTINPFKINIEYNQNKSEQEIWISIQHIILNHYYQYYNEEIDYHYDEEHDYPIFPQTDDIKPLIFDNLKFVKGSYVISCTVESWSQTIGIILSNIKKNETQIFNILNSSTLRFPNGTMKVRRNIWKSPAILIDIHQESEREFIQGIKRDKQPLYDSHPSLFGGNGTYVGPEERYYVLKFKVLRPRQECFCHQNEYVDVETFIRKYYLPKINRERMSSNLLKEINEKIHHKKLVVYTRDFDKDGAVSKTAIYSPLEFNSWEEYLKTIL